MNKNILQIINLFISEIEIIIIIIIIYFSWA